MAGQPFLPYGRQTVEDDDIAAVVEVLRSDYLTTGPAVGRFEAALASRVGSRHAVAVSNGTAALHAACHAAGVGEGDEVVVPALTFLATANCARYVGAEPVFADVDPDTGLVGPVQLEPRMGARTRAVIPVHLTGTAVDMPGVRQLADQYDARVIEDAAHGLGGGSDAQPMGCCADSHMAIFSFHPVKHITTAEGGAVTTNDDALQQSLADFRNHGMVRDSARFQHPSEGPWYYEQQLLGLNYRLSDLQAALGSSQLKKLDRFMQRRRHLAALYDERLASLARVLPVTRGSAVSESAYHLYAVLIDFEAVGVSRAELMQRMRERGVGSQVHYMPIPMQPYYRQRGVDPNDFPGAMSYYRRTLSLPLFPTMADSDVDRVVQALEDGLSGAD